MCFSLSRRDFVKAASSVTLGLALPVGLFVPAGTASAASPTKFRVYIGTYTGGNSKGIYRCELDTTTGKLSTPELAVELTSPSFLAVHPNNKFLYAVTEISEFQGKKAGAVGALSIDPKTGNLKLLNQQVSGGAGPCHVNVDRAGKNVLVANYGGGSCASLPIQADGSLGAASSVRQHQGSSVDKGRQEGPHAHSINLDPAGKFAFVADLGLDKVLVYRFDSAHGTLTDNDPPAADVAPGAGPRHFAFHPSGKFAYVINEMASTVTAFSYDAQTGKLTTLQSISTLPEGYKGNTSTAEVVVHPSGKFLYGSNRGHNSITAFAIDQSTGKLTFVGHQGENVKVPRNFAVDPTGKWVLVANQDGDSIVVFQVDQASGKLLSTGVSVAAPKPVCVRFVPLGE